VLAALPVTIVLLYRSIRRARAARRVGLDGFTAQAPRVGDAERHRKVAALRREIGDWKPGLNWLDEFVDAITARPQP
jgi:hypothetical protein